MSDESRRVALLEEAKALVPDPLFIEWFAKLLAKSLPPKDEDRDSWVLAQGLASDDPAIVAIFTSLDAGGMDDGTGEADEVGVDADGDWTDNSPPSPAASLPGDRPFCSTDHVTHARFDPPVAEVVQEGSDDDLLIMSPPPAPARKPSLPPPAVSGVHKPTLSPAPAASSSLKTSDSVPGPSTAVTSSSTPATTSAQHSLSDSRPTPPKAVQPPTAALASSASKPASSSSSSSSSSRKQATPPLLAALSDEDFDSRVVPLLKQTRQYAATPRELVDIFYPRHKSTPARQRRKVLRKLQDEVVEDGAFWRHWMQHSGGVPLLVAWLQSAVAGKERAKGTITLTLVALTRLPWETGAIDCFPDLAKSVTEVKDNAENKFEKETIRSASRLLRKLEQTRRAGVDSSIKKRKAGASPSPERGKRAKPSSPSPSQPPAKPPPAPVKTTANSTSNAPAKTTASSSKTSDAAPAKSSSSLTFSRKSKAPSSPKAEPSKSKPAHSVHPSPFLRKLEPTTLLNINKKLPTSAPPPPMSNAFEDALALQGGRTSFPPSVAGPSQLPAKRKDAADSQASTAPAVKRRKAVRMAEGDALQQVRWFPHVSPDPENRDNVHPQPGARQQGEPQNVYVHQEEGEAFRAQLATEAAQKNEGAPLPPPFAAQIDWYPPQPIIVADRPPYKGVSAENGNGERSPVAVEDASVAGMSRSPSEVGVQVVNASAATINVSLADQQAQPVLQNAAAGALAPPPLSQQQQLQQQVQQQRPQPPHLPPAHLPQRPLQQRPHQPPAPALPAPVHLPSRPPAPVGHPATASAPHLPSANARPAGFDARPAGQNAAFEAQRGPVPPHRRDDLAQGLPLPRSAHQPQQSGQQQQPHQYHQQQRQQQPAQYVRGPVQSSYHGAQQHQQQRPVQSFQQRSPQHGSSNRPPPHGWSSRSPPHHSGNNPHASSQRSPVHRPQQHQHQQPYQHPHQPQRYQRQPSQDAWHRSPQPAYSAVDPSSRPLPQSTQQVERNREVRDARGRTSLQK